MTVFVVVLLCGIVCLWGSHLFSTPPLATHYRLDGPSGVFRGRSGNTYVVDNARKDILILNDRLEYVRTIRGGDAGGDSFYYATAVTDGPDGIYVLDALYSGVGTLVSAERLWRFEPDGSGGEILYQMDHPDPETAPRQYGRIKSLSWQGDALLLTAMGEERRAARGGDAAPPVWVYRYELSTGKIGQSQYSFGDSYPVYGAADPRTGLPVIIAGDNSIQAMQPDGQVQLLARSEDFPYQLAVDETGAVWYTERNSGALMRVQDGHAGKLVAESLQASYISVQGDSVCLSDGVGITLYEGGQLTVLDRMPLAGAGLRSLLWGLLALAGLGTLLLLALAVRVVVRSWLAYPFFRKIAVVIAVAVVAASALSWYLLSTAFREEEQRMMAQLEAVSDAIVAHTDVELLTQVHRSSHYRGEAFNGLKEELDAVIDAGYEQGGYFYYLSYVTDGKQIYGLMDYEDTIRPGMIYATYGAQPYTGVFETGEPVLVQGEVSTWGAWTLLLKPVRDDSGAIVAVQEVGFNYDNQLVARRQTVVDTVLTILFGAIVLVMGLIEGIYFLEHRRRWQALCYRLDAVYDQTDLVPLRTLIFLAFTVDCMQDAFISILTTDLYEPVLGIPQSVGAALPISGQVLMAAVFAVVGGFLATRFGARQVICVGFLLEAAGFLTCGLLLNYGGILLGKLMVGAGLGMVSVGVNTVAASSPDSAKSVTTFAGITAGTLVGVSAGSGLGSTLLSLGGYRVVFLVGTAILLFAFLLALSGRQQVPGHQVADGRPAEEGEPAGPSIGMGRFLTGRGGTLPFLTLVLTPFMSAIYFREYFFPVYAAENGFTETNIGRVYVLCGLMVIYAGPALIGYLMERLGEVRTVLLSSVLISLATLSFAFLPSMVGAFTGMLLVSVAASCGYTSQSAYYASRPVVAEFGEGRSMGVYSLFDNGGQTLGPIVYGSAMTLGYQTGMLCVGVVLALLTGAFGLLRRRELARRPTHRAEEEALC